MNAKYVDIEVLISQRLPRDRSTAKFSNWHLQESKNPGWALLPPGFSLAK